MLYLILKELTEDKAVYEYHPNGGIDFGIVSVDLKTGKCSIDVFEPQAGKMHASMALYGIRKIFQENNYPERRTIAWY